MNSRLLEIFGEISKIPRCSGDEGAISQFVLDFAENLGLNRVRDDYNNVIIKKSAQGMTGDRIILQSHVDMVCVGEGHNFETDPIELIEKDGWLTGKGTTLGADNGIGMAMMLALMEDENAVHPDLEFIFTTDEERGLAGVANIDLSDMNGRKLLNLDGEEEGIFFVSCAGGVRVVLSRELEMETLTGEVETLEIDISNANGGHSGLDIQKQNANPIKLMARVLKALNVNLHEYTGGDKENSIPTSARAVISFRPEERDRIKNELDILKAHFKSEYPNEENMVLNVVEVEKRQFALAADERDSLVNLLFTIPNGALKFNLDTGDPSLSNNIGLLEQSGGKFTITNLLRSNEDSTKAVLLEEIGVLASVFGFDLNTRGDYPAWEYAYDSPLRDELRRQYVEVGGGEPEFQSVHAGLECAYFAKKRPDWDMISMGANIEYAHTTRERLEIESAHRVYEFLKKLLTTI